MHSPLLGTARITLTQVPGAASAPHAMFHARARWMPVCGDTSMVNLAACCPDLISEFAQALLLLDYLILRPMTR